MSPKNEGFWGEIVASGLKTDSLLGLASISFLTP